MADAVNDAELGRSKQSASPRDHLLHLLSIGWHPDSPLIQKYTRDQNLQKELSDWRKQSVESGKQ